MHCALDCTLTTLCLLHGTGVQVLQRLFLCLDPASLKAAKCVCQVLQYCCYCSLYCSTPGLARVYQWAGVGRGPGPPPAGRLPGPGLAPPPAPPHGLHPHQGQPGTVPPPASLLNWALQVNFVVCDDRSVVCGYNGGNMARLFDIQTGEKRLQLDCGRELQPVLNFPRDGSVQVRKYKKPLLQIVS